MMKNKKKLSLKKMSIAQLDTIKGGEIRNTTNTGPIYTVISYVNCGNQSLRQCGNTTQGIPCQYTDTPTSAVVCVNHEN